MTFAIAIPVWGGHVGPWLTYCLPSMLETRDLDGARVAIHTAPDDVARIKDSPAFRRLASLAAHVAIYPVPRQGCKYGIKSAVYREHLAGTGTDEVAVMLNADMLLSVGFLDHCRERIESGARVVQVMGPRGDLAKIGDYLDYWKADGAVRVMPQELGRVWHHSRHATCSLHEVPGEAGGPFHPSHLYWIDSGGVVARCFHLYPIAVAGGLAAPFTSTIDDDLVSSIGLRVEQVHTIADDSKAFCCELSGETGTPPECRRGDLGAHVGFYRRYNYRGVLNLAHEITVGEPAQATRDQAADFIATLRRHVP